MHTIEGRYGGSLYSVASKKNVLNEVTKDLAVIKKFITSSISAPSFLKDPTVSRSIRKAQISELLPSSSYNEITRNFFGVLAENGRLKDSLKIINAFEEILAANKNEVTIEVTSAKVCLISCALFVVDFFDDRNCQKTFLRN